MCAFGFTFLFFSVGMILDDDHDYDGEDGLVYSYFVYFDICLCVL